MTRLRIHEPRKINALASSVRLAIVGTLEAIGPCSVADLARTLGVAPDSLYYHLRILENHGLVTRSGAIVEVTAAVELSYDAKSGANRNAVSRVAGSVVRAALRAFNAAFHRGVRTSGKRRELWFAQRSARLTAAELEHVNRLLTDLLDIFEKSGKPREKEKLYLLTFALSPYGKR